jgi:hypothetical protein
MNRWGMGIGLLGLMGALMLLEPHPAVAALTCQTVGDHRLCLETAKRSAKHFWQYQAAVTVDGQSLPTQRYDCRAQAPAPLLKTAPESTMTGGSAPMESVIQSFVCRAVTPRR